MKFTNVKQLIIKFMGGGLINFPTRFLRWVKINGDSDDSDDGGGGDGDTTPTMIFPYQPLEVKYWADFSYDNTYPEGNKIVINGDINFIEPQNLKQYIENRVTNYFQENPSQTNYDFNVCPIFEHIDDINQEILVGQYFSVSCYKVNDNIIICMYPYSSNILMDVTYNNILYYCLPIGYD